MKRILLLCATILACGQLFAQTVRISGKVTDAQSKAPVPGATIHITPTGTKTVTNEKGIFSCQVPLKNFSVEVKALGYETYLRNYSSSDTMYLFELAPKTSALQEVKVIGYAPQKQMLFTGSVTTVQGQALAGGMRGVRIRGKGVKAPAPVSQDEFSPIKDNRYQYVRQQPLSTFSSDVDRASFTIVAQPARARAVPGYGRRSRRGADQLFRLWICATGRWCARVGAGRPGPMPLEPGASAGTDRHPGERKSR